MVLIIEVHILILIHEEIDAVARKLMKRNKTVAKVKPQRGKPSWANDSSKGPNSASSDRTRPKRRLSIEDGESVSDEKRPRHGNSNGLEQSSPQHSSIEF